MKVWTGALTGLAAAALVGDAHAQAVQATAAPPAVSAPATVTTARPRLIPTSEFAQQPLFTGPKLSPDGKRMIARFNINGTVRVGIHSFDGTKMRLAAIPPKSDLRWYRWAGNDRILISLSRSVEWNGGDAVSTRIVMIDLRDNSSLVLGPKSQGLVGDDLLHVDPTGDWVLMATQKTIYDYPSVLRVELATNKSVTVVPDREGVWDWYADNTGIVRMGIGYGASGWSMYYRSKEADSFRKMAKGKYGDEDAAFDIVRIFNGSDEGYVLNNKATGRYALYRFNYATKQIGDLVYESKTNDLTGFDTTADGAALASLWYTDDRDRIVWFDETLKKHQADLDAAIKQNENWIMSGSKDYAAMIVWTGASNNPGSYYVYRPTEGVMKRIAKVSATLTPAELATKRYITYKARDGLDIPGYLTLPVGRDPKGLPLIIMPHGGPYDVRDNADYDPEVQFLANRGYAVLQPNFRGSGGYGKAHYEKGEGQKGRTMQDDLDDGMDWLVKQGTVDPKRVCMIGASYGGYAALWGATRNPERYRCAASFAGISDVKRQLDYQLDFRVSRRYRKDWRTIVKGDDKFDLRTVSPLYLASQLKVPVLLAHGDDDQIVPVKQSKLYADALTKAGKPFELKIYPGEGHGFSTDANMRDWLDRLDAFLKTHNPA